MPIKAYEAWQNWTAVSVINILDRMYQKNKMEYFTLKKELKNV
jgi:hypothetical protein